jgi:hypothetical protein
LHDSWKSLDPRYDLGPSFETLGGGLGALYHLLFGAVMRGPTLYFDVNMNIGGFIISLGGLWSIPPFITGE